MASRDLRRHHLQRPQLAQEEEEEEDHNQGRQAKRLSFVQPGKFRNRQS